ncbi:MAG: T9SS type A sorting domain-containing protein [Bacteroidota bacterium]|nr:T9SS type A sorting domain-containing protein [Bacteroidota bacterium]
MKKVINILIVLLAPVLLFSQSRIVFNNANIEITNGAKLVVQNSSPNALTVLSTGGIISEGTGNDVLWNIGTNASSYVVPFISKGNPIPLSFTTSGGAGNGTFILSTYAGPDWNNSNYLPPTVTNIDRDGNDNSNHVIDRFWQIKASGYSANPSLSNLVFAYNENEWSETGNNIIEADLTAQSWNTSSAAWSSVTGTDNPSSNEVTVAAVAGSDLNTWWTLVDEDYALPLTLLSFSAEKQNENALLKWAVAQQINVSYYEVQRSINAVDFLPIGNVKAINNANSNNNYSFNDALNNINSNTIYYRLRMVDRDGKFVYSPVKFISLIANESNLIQLFPNPATNYFIIKFGSVVQGNYILAISDAAGKKVMAKQMAIAPNSTFYFHRGADMAAGTYFISLTGMKLKYVFTIVIQ